jgi:hypothetical protein
MSKIDFSVSRRDLIAGASAAGALAISSFDRAFGKAPLLNTPAPYFYRFKLGSAEATMYRTARCRSATRTPTSPG